MCFSQADFSRNRSCSLNELQRVSFRGFSQAIGQGLYLDFQPRRRAESLCDVAIPNLRVVRIRDSGQAVEHRAEQLVEVVPRCFEKRRFTLRSWLLKSTIQRGLRPARRARPPSRGPPAWRPSPSARAPGARLTPGNLAASLTVWGWSSLDFGDLITLDPLRSLFI